LRGGQRRRWREIWTVVTAGDYPLGLGGSPFPLRQTMPEEEVTGRAGLKLTALRERDGRAEGTAAGTPR